MLIFAIQLNFAFFFMITYTPQNIQYIEIISGIVSYWLNQLTQIKKSNTFSPFFANFVLQTQKKKINGILPPSGVTRSMGLLGSDSKIRFLTSTSSWSWEQAGRLLMVSLIFLLSSSPVLEATGSTRGGTSILLTVPELSFLQ